MRELFARAAVVVALAGVAAGVNAADPAQAVRLVDNGFCAGLAWVTLLPGESVTMDLGPDFSVYRVNGPGEREWGAYSGFAGESRPDRQRRLVSKDGASVFRGTGDDGAFNGYFVGDDGQQNHFFASFFKDDDTDARFFDRVELGSKARAKCAKYNSK